MEIWELYKMLVVNWSCNVQKQLHRLLSHGALKLKKKQSNKSTKHYKTARGYNPRSKQERNLALSETERIFFV